MFLYSQLGAASIFRANASTLWGLQRCHLGLTVSYFVFREIRNCVKQVTVSPVTVTGHCFGHCFAKGTVTGHCFAEIRSFLKSERNVQYGNFAYFQVKFCTFSLDCLLFTRVLHPYIRFSCFFFKWCTFFRVSDHFNRVGLQNTKLVSHDILENT